MPRPLFFLLIALALVGDARVMLFVMNRIVFGSHREERSRVHWLMFVAPPVLLVLTLLYSTTIGTIWLFVAAGIGVYWILDRTRMLFRRDAPIAGVRTLESEVVKLRKAHIPFASLRKLGAHNDVYDIEVTRHEVFVDDLPPSFDGYRIAFLTDTHVASFMRRGLYREVVAQTMRFDPDLILLGGDFVTWERHIPLMAELLLTDRALFINTVLWIAAVLVIIYAR